MGKGLGVTALIFGLIGAGLGGYVFVTNTFFSALDVVESPSIQDTEFIYNVGGCELGTFVYKYLDPISLIISVNTNESLYILFTCYVRLDTTATDAWIAIIINGVTQMYYLITRTSTGTERIPVSIQYSKLMTVSGNYNVSMWGYSNIAFQECYRCGLLVQTFK